MTQAFELNSEKFAAEGFEREVVVLDVINGTYFALGGSAPDLWHPLITGVSLDQIAAELARAYAVPLENAASSLSLFSERLVEEEILRTAGAPSPVPMPTLIPRANEFLPPTFEKHVDMQDLLTLDPIHDVDPEIGWPRV